MSRHSQSSVLHHCHHGSHACWCMGISSKCQSLKTASSMVKGTQANVFRCSVISMVLKDAARILTVSGCRPTEIEVDADGGKRKIRAVAFISPPEMLINEGLPPPDR